MNKGTAGFFLGAMVGAVGTLVFLKLKEEGEKDSESLESEIEKKLGALEGNSGNAKHKGKTRVTQLS